MPNAYSAFRENLVGNLDAAKDRRARGSIFDAAESALTDAGYEPWVFYTAFIINPEVNPSYRAAAINRLHDPARVPEGDATYSIASSIVYVMLDEHSDEMLKSPAFIAGGILRSHNPPIAMLPISKKIIDEYFIPYAEILFQGPKEPSASMNHILHAVPTLAKLTAVHQGAYDLNLSRQLAVFRGIYPHAVEELRQMDRLGLNDPPRLDSYGFVHPLEHLADVMDIAAKTGDKDLIRSLANDGITNIFNDIDGQRIAHGIPDERVERYLGQRDGFSRALVRI